MPKRIKSDDKFICSICNKLFRDEEEAIKHEKAHDIIYVPFEKEDLKRLITYIKTGNPDYMTEHIWDTLKQYDRLKL